MSVFTGRPPRIPDHPGYISALWYAHPAQTLSTANALAADLLYAYPTFIAEPVSIQALGVRFGSLVAGKAKLGIYSNRGGNPDALIAEGTTEIDGNTSTTLPQTTGFAANVPMPAGWCWLVMCCNAALVPYTLNPSTGGGAITHLLGGAAAANAGLGTAPTMRVTRALTYAGPGAFFPASYGAVTRGTAAPGSPVIAWQAA